MESNREVFIKMRESEYDEIPNEIKERYFNSKNVSKLSSIKKSKLIIRY